jgi:DNA modification methylase
MSKITLQWKTEKRKVSELIPADYNPRQMSDAERRDLLDSIKEFDQVVPVVINTDGKLIGGHQRCHIYSDLEIDEIEVRVPDRKLTLEEERRLNLRLNKNTGHWDFDKLGKFDVETLLDVGFGDEDLSAIWDNVDTLDDDHNKEESAKIIKETSIKAGDIYELGSHRLMCGDSTDQEQVKKLVGDNKINMIYNDPSCKIDDDYSDFVKKIIENSLTVADKNVHVYSWCDEKFIGIIQSLFSSNGIENKRVCMWIKSNFNATPQVAFNKAYEPCVYGVIGRPYLNSKIKNFNEILNKEIIASNQIQDEIGDLFNIWIARRKGVEDYEHPNQKPITLHEKPIKRTTRIGDNILDLFGGSGSTLMSAEQLGRKSFLMEIDPVFCQVIINRWEEFTGKKAKKI